MVHDSLHFVRFDCCMTTPEGWMNFLRTWEDTGAMWIPWVDENTSWMVELRGDTHLKFDNERIESHILVVESSIVVAWLESGLVVGAQIDLQSRFVHKMMLNEVNFEVKNDQHERTM